MSHLQQLLHLAVLLPPLAYLLSGALLALRSGRSSRASGFARTASAASAWIALVSSFSAAALLLLAAGPLDQVWFSVGGPWPVRFGLYFDGLSATLSLLIAFVGLVVVGFSARSLEGERGRDAFLGRICLTLGAVLLFVVSRNLLMLAGCWMLASYGLHQLLTHYGDREAGVWAARKKFLVSRIGDVCLIAAACLCFKQFGTVDLPELFEAAGTADRGAWSSTAIALCLAFAAMTKSAQIPFHSWLPETLEAPTPVSALMHAGIINAGGFLLIRLSPLVVLSEAAMLTLALVGAATALIAGTIFLTQSTTKRALAYSTVAQMGFMILQCGLGAFSAALLHLVAHSLYKADAFLRAGTLAVRSPTADVSAVAGRRPFATLALVAGLALTIVAGVGTGLGVDLLGKPGGVAIAAILTIAAAQLLYPMALSGRLVPVSGLLAAGLICGLYFAAYQVFDAILSATASSPALKVTTASAAVTVFVVVAFVGLLLLQAAVRFAATGKADPSRRASWLQALYVHARNGFNLDLPFRRLAGRLWKRPLTTT